MSSHYVTIRRILSVNIYILSICAHKKFNIDGSVTANFVCNARGHSHGLVYDVSDAYARPHEVSGTFAVTNPAMNVALVMT